MAVRTAPGPGGQPPRGLRSTHGSPRKLLSALANAKDLQVERLAAPIVITRQTVTAMPQYFFNLTNGETVRDEQGTRCDTVEDVKTYALAVAAELGRNRSPEELNTLALCVIDETGQEVFRTKVVNMQTAPNADAMTRAARNEESDPDQDAGAQRRRS